MNSIFKMKGPMVVIGGAVVVALAAVIVGIFYHASPKLKNTVLVSKMNLQEEVTATGDVKAAQDLDLGFNRSGRVAAVYAKVGDSVKRGQTIAVLDSADLNASLEQAQAAADRENINLQTIQGATANNGTGAQSQTQAAIQSARTSLGANLSDDYVKINGAFGSYVVQFTNNNSINPAFGVIYTQGGTTYYIKGTAAQNDQLTGEISNLNKLLVDWNTANSNTSTDQGLQGDADIAQKTIDAFNVLLSDTYNVLNSYTISTGGDQTIYSTYKGYIAAYQATASQTSASLQAAQTAYQTSLSTAGPTAAALEQTSVESANAQVAGIQAQINNGVITAPIDGTITVMNAKVGEVASPGTPLVSMSSSGDYEIDVYVSEADVGKITVGQSASVTLDAYGDSHPFNASVVSVDPAETMVNNVGSYKVTLQFINPDEIIKEGMTANVSIATGSATSVIAVPEAAIVKQNDKSFVLVPDAKGNPVERQVTTGITGANGYVEITSGLNEGDKIYAFGS